MLFRYFDFGLRFGQCNTGFRTQERVFSLISPQTNPRDDCSILCSGCVSPHFYSASPTVARMTSSGVVKPAKTFRMPSSRNVRIPISRARERRTEVGTFS